VIAWRNPSSASAITSLTPRKATLHQPFDVGTVPRFAEAEGDSTIPLLATRHEAIRSISASPMLDSTASASRTSTTFRA